MRALAALYVVIHHAWLEIWPTELGRMPVGVARYATEWMAYGHFAVSVFIVLAGFCLTLPVIQRGGALPGGAKRFFLRRARRILPPYYCALVFSIILIWLFIGQKTGTHWDVSIPVSPIAVAANVLLLQDVFFAGTINHAFWSIAVEWRIYFLFPLLVLLRRQWGAVKTTLVVLLLAYTLYLGVWLTPLGKSWLRAFPQLGNGSIGFAPAYVALFGLGMLAAYIATSTEAGWSTLRARIPWSVLALAITIVLIALCWQLDAPYGLNAFSFTFCDLLVGAGAACILVSCAWSGNNTLRNVLGWKPLAFVGGFSYSLYLIHAPLIQVVWQLLVRPFGLSDGVGLLVLLVIGLPLIVGAAYLFFLVCERPFMTGRRAPARNNQIAHTHTSEVLAYSEPFSVDTGD